VHHAKSEVRDKMRFKRVSHITTDNTSFFGQAKKRYHTPHFCLFFIRELGITGAMQRDNSVASTSQGRLLQQARQEKVRVGRRRSDSSSRSSSGSSSISESRGGNENGNRSDTLRIDMNTDDGARFNFNKRYICSRCQASFSRSSHLRRHALIHEPTDSHVCESCNKSFSRLDALRRHRKVHNTSKWSDDRASSGPTSFQKAEKVKKSCERCSRMKLRCEGGRPCQRCKGIPFQDCIDQVIVAAANQVHLDDQQRVSADTASPQASRIGNDKRKSRRIQFGADSSCMLHPDLDEHVEQAYITPNTYISGMNTLPIAEGTEFLDPMQAATFDHNDDSFASLGNNTGIQRGQSGVENGLSRMEFTWDNLSDVLDVTNFDWLFDHHTTSVSSTEEGVAPSFDFFSTTAPETQSSSMTSTSEYAQNYSGQQKSPLDCLRDVTVAQSYSPWPVSSSTPVQPMTQIEASASEHSIMHGGDHGQNSTFSEERQSSQHHSHQAHAAKRRRILPQDLVSRQASRRSSPTPGHDSVGLDGINVSPARRRLAAPIDSRDYEPRMTIEPGAASQAARAQDTQSNVQTWPNAYYPRGGFNRLNFKELCSLKSLNIDANVIAEESSCQVEAIDEHSVRKLVTHFADHLVIEDANEEQITRSMLESINVETWNTMLQLFFEKFQPMYPFLHQATFDTSSVNPFLLVACCAVGCSYSRVPHANLLAEFLMDHVHTAMATTCLTDNLHSRSLSIIQALLLSNIFFGTSGNQRLLEHAEFGRSATATMVRRCRLLDFVSPGVITAPPLTQQSSSKVLSQNWRSWIKFESLKRTAWACVLADVEFSAIWKLPSMYGLDELKLDLPSSERRWIADTAELWNSHRKEASIGLTAMHERLEAESRNQRRGREQGQELDQSFIDLTPSITSAFGAKIIALSLHLYGQFIRRFNDTRLLKIEAEPISQAFKEMILSTCSSIAAVESSPATVAFEVMARFVHLVSCISLNDLRSLVDWRNKADALNALRKLTTFHQLNQSMAEQVALSCGRIIYLVRSQPALSPYDGPMVFFASLYLYAFSKMLQNAIVDDRLGSSSMVFCLDHHRTISIAEFNKTISSTKGVRYQLRYIGDLSARTGPSRILRAHSKLLKEDLENRSSRKLSGVMGQVLEKLAVENETSLKNFSSSLSM
jgi:hypothetical protein